MTIDKLALVSKVAEQRSQKQRAAWQASTAAVIAKREDIKHLKSLQDDYHHQIDGWQSGLAMALRDRLSMYGNLTAMLRHVEDELAQLLAMEQRCATALNATLQQIEGLEKLQEQRRKVAQQNAKRAARRAQ